MNLLDKTVSNVLSIVRDERDRTVAAELLQDIAAGRCVAVPLMAKLGPTPEDFGTLVYEVRSGELVIHAIFSKYVECDMTDAGCAKAEQLREEFLCHSIRCDTRRPGLVKKLRQRGWVIDSVALVKRS